MSNNANENNGHPAWQEVLNEIPEEFHPLIKPKLAEWDKGVQERFQQIRDEYKPLEGYRKFAENKIDPEYLVNSYNLARNFEQQPQAIVEEAIKVYNLDFAPKQDEPEYNEYEEQPNGQLDPAMKALMDQMQQLQQRIDQQAQSEEEAQNIREYEQYLESLEETHGQFDRDYITALISQGVDGEEAVKRYKSLSAQQLEQQVLGGSEGSEQQKTPNPPTVMNGEGNSGSGLEQQPIDFGKASSGDIDDVVAKMLAASQQNNQG